MPNKAVCRLLAFQNVWRDVMKFSLFGTALGSVRNRAVFNYNERTFGLEGLVDAFKHFRRLRELVIGIGNENGVEGSRWKHGIIVPSQHSLQIGDVLRVRLAANFCKDGLLDVHANDLPAWHEFFRYSKRVINRKAGSNVRNRRAWVKAKGIVHLRVKLIELSVCGLLSEGKTRG